MMTGKIHPMDHVLAFIDLPLNIRSTIISYGYCHPLLNKIRQGVPYADPKTLLNKQKMMAEFVSRSNHLIRDQVDDHIFALYPRETYYRMIKWFYEEKNLKKKDYLKNTILRLGTDFPKYSYRYSSYKVYRFKLAYE